MSTIKQALKRLLAGNGYELWRDYKDIAMPSLVVLKQEKLKYDALLEAYQANKDTIKKPVKPAFIPLNDEELVKLALLAALPKDMSYTKSYLQLVEGFFAIKAPSKEQIFLYIFSAALAGESSYVNALGPFMKDEELGIFLNILIQARAKNYQASLSFYKKSKKLSKEARATALFYASLGMPIKWQEKFKKISPPFKKNAIYELHLVCEGYKSDANEAFKDSLRLINEGKINQVLLALMCDHALSNASFKDVKLAYPKLKTLCDTVFLKGVLAVFFALNEYLRGDRNKALSILRPSLDFLEYKEDKFNKNHQVFFALIYNYSKILRRDDHLAFMHKRTEQKSKPLLAIGASESLIVANNYVILKGVEYKALPCFVMGLKAFHFGKENKFYTAIKEHFKYIKGLKGGFDLLFTSGNIDCRSNDGIWKNSLLQGKPWQECMRKTVDDYLDELIKLTKGMEAKVLVQGVQAVKYPLKDDYDPLDLEEFLKFCRGYNEYLAKACEARNFVYIDIFTPSVGEDGLSNGLFDIDDHHVDITVYERSKDAVS